MFFVSRKCCSSDIVSGLIVGSVSITQSFLLGDASYCTPEQYKDCAEPALGKSADTHTHTHTHTHTTSRTLVKKPSLQAAAKQ